MVVHGKLVERAVCLSDLYDVFLLDIVRDTVCLSDLYDVFLLDIVRDTRQNLWTMIYRSQ